MFKSRKNIILFQVIIVTFLIIIIASFFKIEVLHVIMGLPLALFFSGYVLATLLSPREDGHSDFSQKFFYFCFSVATSTALVALTAIALEIMQLTLGIYPALLAISIFTVLASSTAIFIRSRAARKEQVSTAALVDIDTTAGTKPKLYSLWIYVSAVAIAELLTVFVAPLVGLACHWILLIYSLVQTVFNIDKTSRDLLLGLSLIPLIRIISISLPLAGVPQLYWYLLIYLPLLAATLAVIRILGLKLKQVGFVLGNVPLQISLGIISGFSLGTLEYLILKPAPIVSSLSIEEIWLPSLVLLVTTGFVEELIFRGVLQKLAVTTMGVVPGIIYVSLAFAVLHFGFYSALGVFFVFLVAVIFAVVVKKTGSLLAVTLSHGLTNIMLFAVAPFILG